MQMGRHWCPFGFGVGGQLRKDRDEPLSEGKLLQSQGSGRSNGEGGLAAAGRQIVLRATLWRQPIIGPGPLLASELCAREVVIDLAGDVALEDSDDLGFGAALFQTALHIGLGAGIRAQAGDHNPRARSWPGDPAAIEPRTRVTLPEEAWMGATPQRWRPGGLRADSPGIVTGGHEKSGRSVDANAVDLNNWGAVVF